MIRYTKGNLLEAEVEALVNTVNTAGVMGKGVALQFKEAFPENFKVYAAACQRGEVEIGRMFVTQTGRLEGPRWIINFPTKKHWRQPSKLEYVEEGLEDLVRVVHQREIRSLALPPLGCGHGGLEWAIVKNAIESALAKLPAVDVLLFEPTDRYQTAPKTSGVATLTAARAMLVDLIDRYSVLGFECTNLEVQKLAYFLQRVLEGMGIHNALDLRFVSHKYGPYADALRHLLDGLDGSYLHCPKRLSDAGPFDPIRVDTDRLEGVRQFLGQPEMEKYLPALTAVDRLIDGFQSPYLLELLATVDWVVARDAVEAKTDKVLDAFRRWSTGNAEARRKTRLFDAEVVGQALDRLDSELALRPTLA